MLKPFIDNSRSELQPVFTGLAKAESTYQDGQSQLKLTDLLNRLSLELMLVGRGNFAPTVFTTKTKSGNDKSLSAMMQPLKNRLSLELMLLGRGEIAPATFTKTDVVIGKKLKAVNAGKWQFNHWIDALKNRLSLELMLVGWGEFAPAVFTTQDIIDDIMSRQTFVKPGHSSKTASFS